MLCLKKISKKYLKWKTLKGTENSAFKETLKMYQNRSELSKKIPLPRKGTKYVVRADSDPKNSVPLLIALRDMLKLTKTTNETKKILKQKIVKINGKIVENYHRSVKLFYILDAGKSYLLTLNEHGKFTFIETDAKERLCKVINKKMIKGGKIQLNMLDGTNVITNKKININDSVYLDFNSKIIKHVKFENGCSCLIIDGKYIGKVGKIDKVENKTCFVKIGDKTVELDKRFVIVK